MGSSLGRAVALAAVPALVLAACGGGDDDGGDEAGGRGPAVRVVAGFYPLAEAATRVGGDRVEVTNLTPVGAEPHDLEIEPDDVDTLEDADVVLYLGQGFQPAVEEIAGRLDAAALDLLDGIALDEAEAGHEGEEGDEGGDGDDHDGLDPHFWLDPQLFVDAVEQIEGALADASPGDAETFAANAQDYIADLTALDEEIEGQLTGCERDDMVVSHAAFHYLAERYGLEQVPVAGLSPEVEPDPDRIAELADLIEERDVTTVFYEDLVSPEVAETLAREARVDTAQLSPLEGLTDDQNVLGEDYTTIMRANAAALVDALGCSGASGG
jgi:zinc transport system substrate-binding protein